MSGNLLVSFLMLSFIFIPVERLFALRRSQPVFRKGWFNDIIHFFINNFLVQIGLFITVGLMLVGLRRIVNLDFQRAVATQPTWLQFLEAIFLADLAFYLAHRLSHSVPLLWKFHAIHHSIEEMDWLASARLHPLDQIFHRSVVILPLYMMGFSTATFGLYLTLTGFQALLVHSNVRWRYGPLRWLFATPEFHHWHHAGEPQAINKNFAGQFPWLDLLFGTLHLPTGRMPLKYGLSYRVPATYLRQLAYPFRKASSNH